MPLELPHTLGWNRGNVVAAGPGVTEFTAGDDVSAMRLRILRGVRDRLGRHPRAPAGPGLTFEQAATLPIGAVTAWVGPYDIAHLEAGQRVLAQGGAAASDRSRCSWDTWKARL